MRIFLTSLVMIVTSSLSERSYAWSEKDKRTRLLERLNPIGKTHVVAPLLFRSCLHFYCFIFPFHYCRLLPGRATAPTQPAAKSIDKNNLACSRHVYILI